MKKMRLFVTAAVFVLLGVRAHSHHSFAIYDSSNPITLEGIVEEFRWTNPHTLVKLRVANDDGTESTWELEYGPINMLARSGWTRTTLEPGDEIAVEVHPLYSGQLGGRFMSFEFLDARTSEPLQSSGGSTILTVPRPDPVEMSGEVARDFNGIWFNANGGIHFDSQVPRSRQMPPLRPEYLARWQQRRADAAAGKSTLDPTAECLPAGFPRFLSMVYPGEILQTDHQLNWYAEWGEATVRIYLDGREPPQDLPPSYNGFTTGHWEGNTLVTRTAGLRDDTLVDTTGVPHSEELTVTMRMKKITPDYLEVDVTLEDPVVFYEPWSTVKRYVRAPADEYIREFTCFEGNRYRIGADGEVEVIFDEPPVQ
jgi:hypothetical protein